MRRGYLDLADGQVHLRECGEGETLVLLLHQTAASSVMFERFATELTAGPLGSTHRFVALDTPGFGMSYRPAAPYNLADWARVVGQAADALGATSFHLLGHHTGAAIAMLLAAAAPERVASLAMIGPLVLSVGERAEWEASVTGLVVDEAGSQLGTVWQQVATIDGDPLAYPPDLALRQRETVDKLAAGERWHEAYLTVFRTDLGAALASTTCPAVLFSGVADVLHPFAAATLAARDGIEFHELAAGAYLLDQQPALVAEPYARFLERVPRISRDGGPRRSASFQPLPGGLHADS
ncbi:alpha/beta hydrolase [Cryobacterium sp.]|jgi:pimeloyl-ACP methyl ester carboxylesterase|uniref:alpha/beta fold hydrolase n=1 Tax=Cryobacterium sp. TaxID=1926290 RepID=UPI00260CFC74|nr:alpha/beta hydrolase [Cryobacterium sp.]MCU1446423.1 Alpha/beta hydrolase fold protein [Cryobacterium sp.]